MSKENNNNFNVNNYSEDDEINNEEEEAEAKQMYDNIAAVVSLETEYLKDNVEDHETRLEQVEENINVENEFQKLIEKRFDELFEVELMMAENLTIMEQEQEKRLTDLKNAFKGKTGMDLKFENDKFSAIDKQIEELIGKLKVSKPRGKTDDDDDVNRRITRLEKTKKESEEKMNQMFEDVNKKVNEIKEKVNKMELTQEEKKVMIKKKVYDSVETKITQLFKLIQDLNVRVSSLTTQVKTLNEKVETIEEKIPNNNNN